MECDGRDSDTKTKPDEDQEFSRNAKPDEDQDSFRNANVDPNVEEEPQAQPNGPAEAKQDFKSPILSSSSATSNTPDDKSMSLQQTPLPEEAPPVEKRKPRTAKSGYSTVPRSRRSQKEPYASGPRKRCSKSRGHGQNIGNQTSLKLMKLPIDVIDNEIIENSKETFKVIKRVSAGSFSDIYLVQKDNNKQKLSLKAEAKQQLPSRLKMEATFYKQFWANSNKELLAVRKHVSAMHGVFQTTKIKCLILDALGPTLYDIQQWMPEKAFDKHTALNISMQTLMAIYGCHKIGWIHRNINLHCFSVSPTNEAMILMSDLSTARCFRKNGKIRAPRHNIRFLGTYRYASRAAHMNKELGKRDDLESWFYTILELFDPEVLLWRGRTEVEAIVFYKNEIFKHAGFNIYKFVPPELKNIVDELARYRYEDEPDYNKIMQIMGALGTNQKLQPGRPGPWVEHLNDIGIVEDCDVDDILVYEDEDCS